MTATNLEADLNATIATAVRARIEAEVTKALAGDEVMSKYVAAALSSEIEVPADRGSYQKRKTTFLREAIDTAIKGATKAAIAKIVAEERAAIEAAVTTELRKNVKNIAAQLVNKVAETTESAYGVTVELKYANK